MFAYCSTNWEVFASSSFYLHINWESFGICEVIVTSFLLPLYMQLFHFCMRSTMFAILLCNFNIATTICLPVFANKRYWPWIPAQCYSKTSFTVLGTGETAIFLILCLERVALDWGDGLVGKSACRLSMRTWVWIPSTHQGRVFLQPSARRPDGADHHPSSRSERPVSGVRWGVIE